MGIAGEFRDALSELLARLPAIRFPVPKRLRAHAEFLSQLRSVFLQFEPPFPKQLTEGLRGGR